MKKVALFVFNGDPLCFIHVALNAMDMKDRGYDVKVIVEGEATKLISLLRNETKPGAAEFKKLRILGLIDCVCKACANKNTVLPAVVEQGFKVCDELSGHPSIARYKEAGYEVLVF
ncbi:MAG: cytoplasmic protein [candidate division WOR-3 bacterium]